MKPYWFKAKTYGYGWVPATWQGWVVLIIYLLLILLALISDTVYFHQIAPNLISLFSEIGFFTVILIFICYYTGEKPSWRWGKKTS